MMRGGPLRVVATAGAAVAAGMFTLSMASSVSLGVLSTVVEKQRVMVLHFCLLSIFDSNELVPRCLYFLVSHLLRSRRFDFAEKDCTAMYMLQRARIYRVSAVQRGSYNRLVTIV